MLFVTEQCKNQNLDMLCVTFDLQLYVKAFEIVSPMKIRILVHLGGFHQLTSFLDLTGKVMEENGLGIALEVIYTPVTASHVEWKSL